MTRGAAPGLAFLLTAVSAIAGPAAVERDVAGEVGASAVYVTSIEAPKIVAQRFDPAGKERPRVEIELRGSVVSETVCPFERLVIEKTAIAVSDWEESWELAVKPVTLGDVSLTSKACPATLTVREFTARLVLEPSLWRKEVPGRTYRYRIQTGGRARSFAVLLDREAGWSLEVHGDDVHASARRGANETLTRLDSHPAVTLTRSSGTLSEDGRGKSVDDTAATLSLEGSGDLPDQAAEGIAPRPGPRRSFAEPTGDR